MTIRDYIGMYLEAAFMGAAFGGIIAMTMGMYALGIAGGY